MLKYLFLLLLVPAMAFAQEAPRQGPHGYFGQRLHGYMGGGIPLDNVSQLPGSGENYLPIPSAKIEPPQPLFTGELTPAETDLIAKALDRLAIELSADDKTVVAASNFRTSLLASPHETLADIRALPTIGLALGRATNVEVDRKDENGIMVIDNAASRAASKPYCDLLKKLNPKAGCVVW